MAAKVYKAQSVVLLNRPVGFPSTKLGETVGIKESDVSDEVPSNAVLVQVKYFSVDPYLRNRMRGAFEVNEVIPGFVSGKILKSNHPNWVAGDLFGAHLPFSSYQVVNEADLVGFRKLTGLIDEGDLSLGVGILGMTGSTAYAGIDLMNVSENDRVWISAATGAVGSLAGQIAKNVKKAQLVIGSAGSDEKCKIAVSDFGYDHCLNYKNAKDAKELSALVKENAPDGIDFYFELVGGDHFTAALSNLRPKGRVAVCGSISRYNQTTDQPIAESLILGPIVYQQQRIEGFVCFEWLSGKRGNFLEEMSSWYKAGLVKSKETVYEGIEKWPEAFHSLFIQGGDNLGKVVVKVESSETIQT